MQFPNDLASLKELLARLPQQQVAQSISALLVVYIAYLAAEFTWLVAEPEQQTSVIVTGQATSKSGEVKKVSTSSVQKLNLFGDYSGVVAAPSAQDLQDAPETKLDLVLAGVVATGNVDTAAAIIERRSKQETYGIGEKITGTHATLEKVFHDRVIIKSSGKLETLMLDGFDFNTVSEAPKKIERKTSKTTKTASHTKKTKKVDHRRNTKLSRQASAVKADINNDPSKIGDYLRISPKKVEGNIVGYRLRPGKKPQFFREAGLKSGDVAIEMNGYDLTNPLDAAQALQALKQEQEISLLIDRNGDMNEILFSVE